jgi:hypothetical protein
MYLNQNKTVKKSVDYTFYEKSQTLEREAIVAPPFSTFVVFLLLHGHPDSGASDRK